MLLDWKWACTATDGQKILVKNNARGIAWPMHTEELFYTNLQNKQKKNRFSVENFTNVVSNAHALHRVLTCETQQYQVTYKWWDLSKEMFLIVKRYCIGPVPHMELGGKWWYDYIWVGFSNHVVSISLTPRGITLNNQYTMLKLFVFSSPTKAKF